MQDLVFRSCERLTQAEFAEWVKTVPHTDLHHYELLDGFIVREPPAGWPHGEIEVEIGRRLATFVRAAKAGRTFGSSQGFDLPTGDTVEPDVSFVAKERWAATRPVPGYLRVVPDLVFEVLSPSTARVDKDDKKRIYERNGVREYVLVDSIARTFECFWLGHTAFGSGRVLTSNDTFESRVLPGFAVDVGEVFADL